MNKPNDKDLKSCREVCGYFFGNFVYEMTKEFVEKMQIKIGLQFPETDENISGLTLNSNNVYPSNNTNIINSRGFDGLDHNIRPFNDVRVTSTNAPHLESKYENLAGSVLNANPIISSNKLNTDDKRVDTPAIKLS